MVQPGYPAEKPTSQPITVTRRMQWAGIGHRGAAVPTHCGRAECKNALSCGQMGCVLFKKEFRVLEGEEM